MHGPLAKRPHQKKSKHGVLRGRIPLGYPLELAARHGHSSIAQRLLDVKADNTSALVAALETGHELIINIPIEARVRVSRLEFPLVVERC